MRHLRRLWIALAAWTVPAVLSTSLIVVRQRDAESGLSWWGTLLQQLPSWWIWGLLTPLVLWTSRKWVIEGHRWWRPLLAHAGFGVGVVLLYLALEAPFAINREGRQITVEAWGNAVVGGFAFQFITQYLIFFALVGVGHALAIGLRLRERDLQASRLAAQLADARLQSLRSQLQPHFLFNTLHAIGGLVREGDSARAVRMISGLSDLLRHSLDHVQAPEIPLHAEIEALEHYLEIEEIRFEDRLDVERTIAPEVADVMVPALLLQPLVENAIRHGVERRNGARRVAIDARREGESLVLRIRDDGVGIPLAFDLDRHQGVGLGSASARLKQLYGDRGSITLRRLEPHGTEVTVHVPMEATDGI